jgi:ankyrin repeat protein
MGWFTRKAKAADFERRDPTTGKTVLHQAAQTGNFENVRSMLQRGANVNAISSSNGAIPLHYAAEGGHLGIAQLLIQAGADVNARAILRQVDIHTGRQRLEGRGNTPVFIAAAEGHLAVVKFLLEAGADPNIGNVDGATPLAMAAQRGHAAVVKCLLPPTGRADPNKVNERGAAPLHLAAGHGYTEIVRLLLAAGAKIDVATQAKGDTPLHDAALSGHEEVVTLLLDYDAKINHPENQGYTPLHLAAYGGFPKIVSKLLSHGANREIRNRDGLTADQIVCKAPSANKGLSNEIHTLLAAALRPGIDRSEHGSAQELSNADISAPSRDGFTELTQELVRIGRPIDPGTGASTYLNRARRRARAIGETLCEQGGLELMLAAHERVRLELGGVAARELEAAWDGIGEWMG